MYPRKNPTDWQRNDTVEGSSGSYQQLAEVSLDGIIITDLDGRALIANPAVLAILEIERDPARLSLQVFDFIAPESMETVRRDFSGMREGKQGIVRTYAAVTAKKNSLFVEVLGNRITYEGKPANIISVRDVTRRRKMEAALLASEAKYRLLAENSLDIINHHDGNLVLTYISPAVTTVLGYDPDWITGRNVLEFIWPEDISYIRTVHGRLVSGESDNETIEYRLTHRDGFPVWVESTVHAIADPLTGRKSEFYNVTRDITARKRAEEAAHRRERVLHGFAAAQGFLLTGRLDDPLPRVLATIGEATGADMAYIYLDSSLVAGSDYLPELKYCWSKEPACKGSGPSNTQAGCRAQLMEVWNDRLSSGAWIAGPRSRFSGSEREMLDEMGIRSVLVVPLFVREAYWGFIGLSDTGRERVWEDAEIEILMTLAATIGIVLEKLWFSRFWMQQIGIGRENPCLKTSVMLSEKKKVRTG